MTKDEFKRALKAYEAELDRWVFRYWDIKAPYGWQAVRNDERDPRVIGKQTIHKLGDGAEATAERKFNKLSQDAAIAAAIAASR